MTSASARPTSSPTRTTSGSGQGSALSRRSRASPPAGCRRGSSACTCWWPTRSRPARGSTRWVTRRWSSSGTRGARTCARAECRVTEPPTPEGVLAQGAEPQVGLSRLPWLHWPYVVVPLVGLVLLLGTAAWAFPGLLARLQLGDYRTSERQVREFAWPAELHDDPTFTACGGFATRCARTELAPEAALRAALPALAAAGLDLGPVQCGAEADAALFWRVLRALRQSDCTAVARKAGFSVQALAPTYPARGAGSEDLDLGYTQVSLVLSPESERLAALVEPTSATGTHAPLPARAADVPGLPALLRSLACTQPEGDGCRAFEGTIALPDPGTSGVDATAATLTDDLRAGGYSLQMSICRDVDVGRRCTVSGLLFRAAGGNDRTSVVVIVSDEQSAGVSILASVTAP